jgi:YHS domain-containing protein
MKSKHVTLTIVAVLTAGLVVGCSNVRPSADQSASPTAQTSPATSAIAQSPNTTTSTPTNATQFERGLIFADENGIAIRGTDPVAYFTEGRPVQGNSNFSHQWMNATWHFASAENRDRFAANPEQYAPQYGGYCAFAVANNYAASTIPEAWSIVDGKLYLNFDLGVRDRWEGAIPDNIAKANQNWPNALKDFKR